MRRWDKAAERRGAVEIVQDRYETLVALGRNVLFFSCLVLREPSIFTCFAEAMEP